MDEWQYGKIWFPGKHDLCAHLGFEKIPDKLSIDLDEFMQKRGVGQFNFGYNKVESFGPSFNEDFILSLEEFVSMI